MVTSISVTSVIILSVLLLLLVLCHYSIMTNKYLQDLLTVPFVLTANACGTEYY